MSWPVLGTPQEASYFWGWVQILLAMLNFCILGIFFAVDMLPFLRHRERRPALFGIGMVLVAITSAVYALIHGIDTANMRLVGSRGIKPLDIGSLVVCFGPLPMFGWERVRLAQGRPERLVRGMPGWLIVLAAALGFYVGAFIMRTVDVARLHNLHYHWLSFDSNWNLIMALLYLILSGAWLGHQIRVHRRTGQWSVLGGSLGLIFITMAFRRLAQAILIAFGAYHVQGSHEQLFRITDIASVIAVVFFMAVVISLLSRSDRDREPAMVGIAGVE